MQRFDLYLLRQIFMTQFFSMVMLFVIIWFSQSLRLIELLVESRAEIMVYLKIVGLSLPRFISYILAISLAFAVIFVYHRALSDRELIALRAAGASSLRLARPAFLAGLIVSVLSYGTGLFLAPYAQQKMTDQRAALITQFSGNLLQPGEFHQLTPELTIFFDHKITNTNFGDIFLFDQRIAEEPVTITAQEAYLTFEEGQIILALREGNRQQKSVDNLVQFLYFDHYELQLQLPAQGEQQRWLPPRERFIQDLLFPDPADPRDQEIAQKLLANGHERLSLPLLIPAFLCVSLAIILAGQLQRRGIGKRLFLAFFAIVVLQIGHITLADAATQNIWFNIGLYLLPLGAAIAGWSVLHGGLSDFFSSRKKLDYAFSDPAATGEKE